MDGVNKCTIRVYIDSVNPIMWGFVEGLVIQSKQLKFGLNIGRATSKIIPQMCRLYHHMCCVMWRKKSIGIHPSLIDNNAVSDEERKTQVQSFETDKK